ncbi:putative l-galactose dehydrogenase (l-) protein [Botrytis fragariae]|uniref:Putative l-galactose dehydrogenase (L-) protein n=1 Tax=Botrytis fragariae TaxID=1964551 RepID=A0A8H6B311_9HELO|nr:putative l-galactose dehydrogenase (l-) protein [Botrytis fragariae]KAF5878092.1 putative l-galactose dehydrogenase (l-) protein [Botrytis fragariae]
MTTRPPLSTLLPPLICGTGTFNIQYNADPFALPANAIVQRALESGVNAFDTSPYYGPSEEILGRALQQPQILANHPRSSYYLITKCGRIAASEFDYSPAWIKYSISRSLARLHTSYLDVVYLHDVEFVSPSEVLEAIKCLRELQAQGIIHYIGVSGYPVPVLCSTAEMILRETGKPLNCVMSYANFTLQNHSLYTSGLARLRKAGVDCVPNASVLGMGLLRSSGVPDNGKEDWHPAPKELRSRVQKAARWVEERGERLEVVAIRWGLERWALDGKVGSEPIGVSLMGVSNIGEFEETLRVWNSVLDGIDIPGRKVTEAEKQWSLKRREETEALAKGVREILGEYRDFAWASPDEGFVNMRVVKGVVDEVAPMPPAEESGAVEKAEDIVAIKDSDKSSRL